MKTLKSLLTLGLMLCAASQAKADFEITTHYVNHQWDSERITRDKVWAISGSSEQYCRSWSDGRFHEMMDGNPNTWWHTFYNVNKQGSGNGDCHVTDSSCPYHNDGQTRANDVYNATTSPYPHFFLVDLDKDNADYKPWISKVKFTSRPTQDENGQCETYSVYVLDRNDIPEFPLVKLDNSNRKVLYDYLQENSITADVTGTAVNGGVTEITLPQEKQGHYVLFVYNSSKNGYAHCAEFDVQTCEQVTEMVEVPKLMPRDNWSIRACSEQSGQEAANMIDGDDGSIWHSLWNGADYNTNHPHHFFLVDLDTKNPEAKYPVRGIYFKPNKNANSNGVCEQYRVYVLDSAEGLFDDNTTDYNHANLDTFLAGKTAFIDDEFTYDYVTGDNGVNPNVAANEPARSAYAPNDQIAMGHYVLFVLDTTHGNNGASNTNNKFATCAEFGVYEADPTYHKQMAKNDFATAIGKYNATVGFNTSWIVGKEECDVDGVLAGLQSEVYDNSVSISDFQASITDAREEILSNITPKGLVRIFSKSENGAGSHYGMNCNPATNVLDFSSDVYSPISLWYLNYKGNGKFTLKNYHSQTYLSQPTDQNPIPCTADENTAAELTIGEFDSEGYFTIAHALESAPYVYYPYNDNNHTYSRPNAGYGYGHWFMSEFHGEAISTIGDGATSSSYDSQNGILTISFKNAQGHTMRPHSNEAHYADHMVITMERQATPSVTAAPMRREAEEQPRTLNHENFNADGDLEISGITPGTYTLTIPDGYLRGTWNMSAADQVHVEVKDNGDTNTTEIDEIAAEDTPATTAIFDLQGRRLATPIKGINIINGHKVLVK